MSSVGAGVSGEEVVSSVGSVSDSLLRPEPI